MTISQVLGSRQMISIKILGRTNTIVDPTSSERKRQVGQGMPTLNRVKADISRRAGANTRVRVHRVTTMRQGAHSKQHVRVHEQTMSTSMMNI